jgi:hypothetical protein
VGQHDIVLEVLDEKAETNGKRRTFWVEQVDVVVAADLQKQPRRVSLSCVEARRGKRTIQAIAETMWRIRKAS